MVPSVIRAIITPTELLCISSGAARNHVDLVNLVDLVEGGTVIRRDYNKDGIMICYINLPRECEGIVR